jgi:DNA-binding transcriptional ArsR family regulator
MPSGVYVASVEGMVTDDVFAVIAEATRRDILVSLRKGDKAVGELVQELEASQPTISKHLKVLREADLVSMRAQGQKRYYALNPKPLAGIASWLETFDVGPTGAAGAAEASPARLPDARLQAAPDSLAAAAPSAATAAGGAAASQSPAAALASRPAGSPLSPAVVIPAGSAGEDTMPQHIGRTVGRAATKAADLLANLPKFGRKK